MRRGSILAVVLGLVAATSTLGAAEISPEQLVAAAQKTQARLAAGEGAKWTSEIQLSAAVLVVDIAQQGANRHTHFTVRVGARTQPLMDIVQRDGVWYVQEESSFTKCRPNEYPFTLTTSAVFLQRADLFLVTAETAANLGKVVDQQGSVVTYATPVQGPQRETMETYIRELPLKVQNPSPELLANAEKFKILLRDGMRTRVDAANGLLFSFGSGKMDVTVTDFQWAAIPASEFAVAERPWKDQTSDITKGDLTRWAMLSNSATVQPGMKQYELDGRLVNLDTGELRRIPFNGDLVMPGCFLPGRTKVLAVGVSTITGAWSLVWIDLSTGDNRVLRQVTMGNLIADPTLSPDGKNVFVMEASPMKLSSQGYLIDLATGNSRSIGGGIDGHKPSFTADGQAIILNRIEPVDDPRAIAPRSVIRMDLSGQISVLREHASDPIVLGNGRILFCDNISSTWKTCDATGGDVRDYSTPPGKLGFPAVGPDGMQVLMMAFAPGKLPVPTIISPDGSVTRPPVGPGLWAMPSWR